jgi:hypothetical protein
MKKSTSAGFMLILLWLVSSSSLSAHSGISSTTTQQDALSILQKAPGGSDLIFAVDDKWQARTTTMSAHSTIYAVDVEGTKIYVGGTFERINDILMNNVAMYDMETQTWSPLSYGPSDIFVGVSGTVYAIDAVGNDVFIGGTFTNTASGALNHIARFNTDYFYSLQAGDNTQNGVNGTVWTIKALEVVSETKSIAEVSNGGPQYILWVGGQFTQAGGAPANKIALYTSGNVYNTGWIPLNASIVPDGNVYDIIFDSVENVYFTGSFTTIGDVNGTKGVAKCTYEEGLICTPGAIGNGLTGTGNALAIMDGDLYVGGGISHAWGENQDIPVDRLAKFDFDTNEWTGFDTNFGNTIYALYADDTNLYVGGSFSQVSDDLSAPGLAIYDSVNDAWKAAGSGLNYLNIFTGVTWDLAKFSGEISGSTQNQLFVGGQFSTAGGKATVNLASWDATSLIPPQIILNSPSDNATNQPFAPTLKWQLATYASSYDLQISTSSDFSDEDAIVYTKDGLTVEFKIAGIFTDPPTFEHIVDSDLDYNTTYFWRVRGNSDDGSGLWSTTRIFETLAGSVTKTAPVDDADLQSVTPEFKWLQSSEVTKYKIIVSTSADLSSPVIDEILDFRTGKVIGNLNAESTHTYTPSTPLNYLSTYYWNVVGLNSSDEEGVTNDIFQFETAPQVPDKVDLSAPENDRNNISVSPTFIWFHSARSINYSFQLATDSEFNNIVLDEDISVPTLKQIIGFTEEYIPSFTPEEDLDNDTRYHWRVRGENGGGNGEWSNTWNFRTLWPAPPVIVVVSPSDGATDQPIRPTLTWEDQPYANWYYLEIYDNINLTGTPVYSKDEIFSGFGDAKAIGSGENTSEVNIVEFTIDSDLDYSTQYFWQVRGKNNTDDGAFSTKRSFTTLIAAPDQVMFISPAHETFADSNPPKFTWEEADRAESYELQIPNLSDFDDLIVDKTGITDIEYTIEMTLDPTREWGARIRAINSTGPGEWSETLIFGVPPVKVTLNSPGNGTDDIELKPEFSWNSVSTGSSYQIQVSADSEFGSFIIDESVTPNIAKSLANADELNNGVLTFKPENELLSNTKYYWRVRATNTNNASGLWSETWNFTTESGTPEVISLIAPGNTTTKQIIRPVFTWEGDNLATSYTLQLATTNQFTTGLQSFTIPSGTTFTPEADLAYSTTYFWRVRANNDAIQGPFSATWSFTTIADPKPYQPTVNFPSNGETNIHPQPEFSWEDMGEGVTYDLDISLNNTYSPTVISKRGLTTSTYTSEVLLQVNTTYWWRVRAVNSFGTGEWNDFFRFTTTQATNPSAVQNIQARPITVKAVAGNLPSVLTTGAFEVTWDPPLWDGGSPITEYRIIYRLATESTWTVYERPPSTETEAIIGGFTPGETYAFDVLAVNALGASLPTEDPLVVTSIELEELPSEITLRQNYPNPFNPTTIIRYALPVGGQVSLEVYSMLGQRMVVLVQGTQPAGWHTINVDASGWSSGTYIYRLQTDGQVITRKFLLVK